MWNFHTGFNLTFDDVLLVPGKSLSSRSCADVSTDFLGFRLLTPLALAPMSSICDINTAYVAHRFGSLGFCHKYQDHKEIIEIAKDMEKDKIDRKFRNFIPSIGVTINKHHPCKIVDDYSEYGLSTINIDVANAYSDAVIELVAWIKRNSKMRVVAGTIATSEAAKALLDCGVDALRINIGAGSICSTRLKTGFGVPQLGAIAEIREALPSAVLVGEGGYNDYGDLAKGFAAGMNLAISGFLFRGCRECPGEVFTDQNDKQYKKYYGMASQSTMSSIGKQRKPEGVEFDVPLRNSIVEVIENAHDYLQSSFSNAEATNLEKFYLQSKFIQVSPNCLKENGTRE